VPTFGQHYIFIFQKKTSLLKILSLSVQRWFRSLLMSSLSHITSKRENLMTTKYIWQRAIINRHQKCWWHDNNLYRNTHTVANKTTPTHMAKQIPTLNPRDMHMLGRILHDARTCLHVLLLLLLLLSSSSSLCSIFTIIYLKQTMFVGHTVLQLFCNYNLCCM